MFLCKINWELDLPFTSLVFFGEPKFPSFDED